MPAPFRLTRPRIPERAIQQACVEWCAWTKREVVEVGKTRTTVRCFSCGAEFRPRGYQGNSPGCPDLFVHLGNGRWLAVELKGEGTRVTPEQRAHVDAGRSAIVRSVEEFIALVEREEAR